jgi:hypothetical protein
MLTLVVLTALIDGVVIIAPVAFAVVAYWYLYGHVANGWLIVSAVIATIGFARGVARYFATESS